MGNINPKAYCVYIGKEMQYTSAAFGRRVHFGPLRALLVEEHRSGKYHRSSYFEILDDFKGDIKTYKKVKLTVGGPDLLPKVSKRI